MRKWLGLGVVVYASTMDNQLYYRHMKSIKTVSSIIWDYKQADTTATSKCHAESALKLVDLFKSNGGVYIKLGQALGALVYILPLEYTDAFKVFQNQCIPSSLTDLNQLFLKDYGKPIEELFVSFDPEPLGVASLAQVHRAVVSPGLFNPYPTPQVVAVKVQHPYLAQQAPADIKLCAMIVKWVKRIFPDFSFDWLASELKTTLTHELNFMNEAQNAKEMSSLLNNEWTHVPAVYHATSRVLVMECKFY